MPDEIKEIIDAEIVEDTPDDDTPVAAEAEADGDDEPEQAVDDDTPSDDDDWSEEDMRLLSDEERAALLEGDDDGEAGDADPDADDDGAAKAKDEPDAAALEAGAAKADDAEPVKGTSLPDLNAYEVELTTLSDAKKTAFDSWEDGDMTRDEYLAKLDELDTDIKEVVSDQATAKAMHQNVYDSFIKTARGYFKDNPELATDEHAKEYDRHVKAVTGDERYQHMTHNQMLEAAHRLYVAEAETFGKDVPAFKGKAKAKADPVVPKADPVTPKPPRKRPGDDAPKTLANIPVAQATSASDGKYSAISQRLDSAVGEEYERIWSSMSPAEQEAFASMDV